MVRRTTCRAFVSPRGLCGDVGPQLRGIAAGESLNSEQLGSSVPRVVTTPAGAWGGCM